MYPYFHHREARGSNIATKTEQVLHVSRTTCLRISHNQRSEAELGQKSTTVPCVTLEGSARGPLASHIKRDDDTLAPREQAQHPFEEGDPSR